MCQSDDNKLRINKLLQNFQDEYETAVRKKMPSKVTVNVKRDFASGQQQRREILSLREGYGFIKPQGYDDQRIFFHESDLADGLSFIMLHVGNVVSFFIGPDPKKPDATMRAFRIMIEK